MWQIICGKTQENINRTHTHTVCTFTSPLTLEAWQDHLFLLKSAQQEPTSVHTHAQNTLYHTHTVAACFSSGIVIVYLFPTLTQDSTHTVELSKLMWIHKYILYVSDIQ